MGAEIAIQANSAAEWEALQSEGAPNFHVTYTTLGIMFDAIRRPDLDVLGGSLECDEMPAVALAAAVASQSADPETGKAVFLRQLSDLCVVAERLRRGITWG
jgi:hypothetical protein